MLCTSRDVRQYLRDHSVYAIIKALHSATNDENIADLVDRLVQMLMRDDAPSHLCDDSEDEEETKVIEVA